MKAILTMSLFLAAATMASVQNDRKRDRSRDGREGHHEARADRDGREGGDDRAERKGQRRGHHHRRGRTGHTLNRLKKDGDRPAPEQRRQTREQGDDDDRDDARCCRRQQGDADGPKRRHPRGETRHEHKKGKK